MFGGTFALKEALKVTGAERSEWYGRAGVSQRRQREWCENIRAMMSLWAHLALKDRPTDFTAKYPLFVCPDLGYVVDLYYGDAP